MILVMYCPVLLSVLTLVCFVSTLVCFLLVYSKKLVNFVVV